MRMWLFFACLGGLAQDVSEEIQVVVRDVRVHVVDRKGNPIEGLTPEDFILREGKRVQSFAYFEEVDQRGVETIELSDRDDAQMGGLPDEVGSPAPVSLLLMDSSNLHEDAFDAFVEAAREWVRQSADGRTQLKIVHYDEGTNHISPFTTEADKLLVALDRVTFKGAFRKQLVSIQRKVIAELEEQDLLASRIGPQPDLAEVPDELMGSELEGLLLIMDDIQQDLARAVSEKERLKLNHYKAYHNNLSSLSDLLSAFPGPKSIFHISGGIYLEDAITRRYSNTRKMAQNLAYRLNSNGVTVYSLLQAERAAIADVDVIGTGARFNELLSRSNSVLEDPNQLERGPIELSDLTGGFFDRSSDKRNVTEVLNELRDKSRHYYRLVYNIDANQARRRINVTLADRKLKGKVIFGDTFQKKQSYEKLPPAEQRVAFESIMMYRSGQQNDLDCNFRFNRFPSAGGLTAVPVTVDLPLREIPKKGFEIGFAAFGPGDYLQDVIRSVITKPPAGPGIRLRHVLFGEGSVERVRFYVRNLDTGALSLMDQTAEPLDMDQGFRLSELLLFQDDQLQIMPLHLMEQRRKKDKDRDKRNRRLDPLAMNTYLYGGRNPDPVAVDAPLFVFFHMDQAAGNSDDYRVTASIVGEEPPRRVGLETVDFYPNGDNWRYLGRINNLGVASGTYQLRIRVTNPTTNESAETLVAFNAP